MASIQTIPITPTPVDVTETRSVRTDNRPVPVEQVVDMSPETRKLPDTPAQTGELAKSANGTSGDAPLESVLSNIRPVIERLDGIKDVTETLEAEEPDQDDRSMLANEAYKTLRQTDEEKNPVGTA
jgi:hypothetical protein